LNTGSSAFADDDETAGLHRGDCREAYKSHNSKIELQPNETEFGMRVTTLALAAALIPCVLALSACVQRNQVPIASTLNEDDDTFCRAGGKVAAGSSEYVACRKDRDAQRNNAIVSADKKQRDLAEHMLNNPVRP
jgi:hypothetical protein